MIMLSMIGLLVIGAIIGFGIFYLTQNVTLKNNKKR
jgi:hypothetical protein